MSHEIKNTKHLGKIVIESIPHNDQRYETPGDWFYDEEGTLHIKVSEFSDWRYESLIAIHELIEVQLARQAGITVASVDAFDIAFESAREEGNNDEPGDDPLCPVVKQHCIATGVESILASEMGVLWKPYADEVCGLVQNK